MNQSDYCTCRKMTQETFTADLHWADRQHLYYYLKCDIAGMLVVKNFLQFLWIHNYCLLIL